MIEFPGLTPVTLRVSKTSPTVPESHDVWVPYTPWATFRCPTDAALVPQPHPAKLAQTAPLRSVAPRIDTDSIVIHTFREWIEDGTISEMQYETIAMAIAASKNSHFVKNRKIRNGFAGFLGTGMGKTRIAIALAVHFYLESKGDCPTLFFSNKEEILTDSYINEASYLGLPKTAFAICAGGSMETLSTIDMTTRPFVLATYYRLSSKIAVGGTAKVPFANAIAALLHASSPGGVFRGMVVADECDELGAASGSVFDNSKARVVYHAAADINDASEFDEASAEALGFRDSVSGIASENRHHSLRGKSYAHLDEQLPDAFFFFLSASGVPHIGRVGYLLDRLHWIGKGTPFADSTEAIAALQHAGDRLSDFLVDQYRRGTVQAIDISLEGIPFELVKAPSSIEQKLLIEECNSIFWSIYETIARPAHTYYRSFASGIEVIEEPVFQRLLDEGGVVTKKGLAVLVRDRCIYYALNPDDLDPQATEKAFLARAKSFIHRIAEGPALLLGARQRRDVLLAHSAIMKLPAMFERIDRHLAEGRSCVVQFAGTNDAHVARAVEQQTDESLYLLNGSTKKVALPYKATLLSYLRVILDLYEIEIAFDAKQHRFTTKAAQGIFGGKVSIFASMPSDFQANVALLRQRIGDLPDELGPIDAILTRYPDLAVEYSGRRYAVGADFSVRQRNGAENVRAYRAFRNGDARIIVITEAGCRALNLHADPHANNTQQRVHMTGSLHEQPELLRQGFGRVLRSNQVCDPLYEVYTSDLPFDLYGVEKIVKKLGSMGALTAGHRDSLHHDGLGDTDKAFDVTGRMALGAALAELDSTGEFFGVNGRLARFYRQTLSKQTLARLGKSADTGFVFGSDMWNTLFFLPLGHDGGPQMRAYNGLVVRAKTMRYTSLSKSGTPTYKMRLVRRYFDDNVEHVEFEGLRPRSEKALHFRDVYRHLSQAANSACVLIGSMPYLCVFVDGGKSGKFIIRYTPEKQEETLYGLSLNEYLAKINATPLSLDDAEQAWTQAFSRLEMLPIRETYIVGNATYAGRKTRKIPYALRPVFVDKTAKHPAHALYLYEKGVSL